MAGWAAAKWGEPALRGRAGDRLQTVAADDHATLPEFVGGTETGRGGDQHERGDPVRVAQREVGAHRAADGTACVSEALDAHAVQRGEQTVGEVGDGHRGVGGGSAVPRQVVPEDSPVLRELGYLAVPHVPGRSEGRTDDQDRRIVRPVEAVLEQLPRLRALGLRDLLALALGLGLWVLGLRVVRRLRVLRGAVRCLRQPGVQRCLREPRLPRRLRVLRAL